MYLFGILEIALGVPESAEGFRSGAELRVEIPALLRVSRAPVVPHWRSCGQGSAGLYAKGFRGEG